MCAEFQVKDDEKFVEMNNAERYTMMEMYIMPLNCTLKNNSDGKFYGMYILPQQKQSTLQTCTETIF